MRPRQRLDGLLTLPCLIATPLVLAGRRVASA
jgi:hypothetical protein